MNRFHNKETIEKVAAWGEISQLHHRPTPYDLNNTKDLTQMFTMAVGELSDYNHYASTLLGGRLR